MVLLLFLSTLALADDTQIDPAIAPVKAAQWGTDCDTKNDGTACGNVGALYATGQGVPKNETKALHYYERACQFGQPLRCLRAGTFAVNGVGTIASPARAAEFFGLGCKLLDPDNCIAYYAVTHGVRIKLDGTSGELADHPKADRGILEKAMTSLTLACDRGRSNACGNLGGIYEEGDAAPRSLGQALRFYERACELGEGDRCARAARYYANGEGTAPDKGKAEKLFRKFCELKHELTCPLAEKAKLGMAIDLKLAKAAEPPPSPPAPSGKVYRSALDVVSAKDVPPETAALIEACNRGSARACGNAAAAFVDDAGKPVSHAELALKLYAKACELGRAVRCADLARFYAHGWGTEVSKEQEAATLKKACDLGHKPSCVPVPK